MSIPTLSVPEYLIKLYSQPQPITVRPYLVGEEKILLIAQQGNDPKEIQQAVKQVLRACTFNKVDINKLPSFDLEYLYLQLRAKSVNNIVTVNYRCQNVVEEKVCNTLVPVDINLETIQVKAKEGHTNTLWLNEQVGITLAYPTKEILEHVESQNGVFGIDLLQRCIMTIFTKEGMVVEVGEVNPDEVEQFISSLSIPQFKKIQEFFDTMPQLSYDVNFMCPKCTYAQTISITGLMDFFV